MDSRILFITFLLFLCGCSSFEKKQDLSIPEYLNKYDNLTIYSVDQQVDSIKLVKETTFESNSEVLIDGYIGDFEVDNMKRVYIEGGRPGAVGIYVFNSDGSFLRKIGRAGRGPGEFEAISSIDILNDRLYVLDSRLQKFSVFDLNTHTHLFDETIEKPEASRADEFSIKMRGKEFFAVDSGHLLMHFQVHNIFNFNEFLFTRYYQLSKEGVVDSNKILEVKRYSSYNAEGFNKRKFPFTAPFTRHSISAISKDGNIYTVWSEDFFVRLYDSYGNYMRSFYYPVKKAPLNLADVPIYKERKRIMAKEGVPKTWQAVYTIELDDQGLLWVATLTADDSTFDWFVLNDVGELKAKFRWSRRKNTIYVKNKPLIKIKDGYFYIHEANEKRDIDRIVKYKIIFEKRDK